MKAKFLIEKLVRSLAESPELQTYHDDAENDADAKKFDSLHVDIDVKKITADVVSARIELLALGGPNVPDEKKIIDVSIPRKDIRAHDITTGKHTQPVYYWGQRETKTYRLVTRHPLVANAINSFKRDIGFDEENPNRVENVRPTETLTVKDTRLAAALIRSTFPDVYWTMLPSSDSPTEIVDKIVDIHTKLKNDERVVILKSRSLKQPPIAIAANQRVLDKVVRAELSKSIT